MKRFTVAKIEGLWIIWDRLEQTVLDDHHHPEELLLLAAALNPPDA
jgi:hypothetical protein